MWVWKFVHPFKLIPRPSPPWQIQIHQRPKIFPQNLVDTSDQPTCWTLIVNCIYFLPGAGWLRCLVLLFSQSIITRSRRVASNHSLCNSCWCLSFLAVSKVVWSTVPVSVGAATAGLIPPNGHQIWMQNIRPEKCSLFISPVPPSGGGFCPLSKVRYQRFIASLPLATLHSNCAE